MGVCPVFIMWMESHGGAQCMVLCHRELTVAQNHKYPSKKVHRNFPVNLFILNAFCHKCFQSIHAFFQCFNRARKRNSDMAGTVL